MVLRKSRGGKISKFDFHTHTNYSDGTATPEEIVAAAIGKDLEAVAITDHGPRLSVGIDSDRIDRMMEDVRRADRNSEIPVILGMEANVIDQYGNIDIERDLVEELDLIVAGVHYPRSSITSFQGTADYYKKALIGAMNENSIDVIAHPFWLIEDLSNYYSEEDFERIVDAAVENGVAIELNERHSSPSARFLSICKRKRAKFSLGSDAHDVEAVGRFPWTKKTLETLEIGENQLVLDEILEKRG